jgi:hypothetical protein
MVCTLSFWNSTYLETERGNAGRYWCLLQALKSESGREGERRREREREGERERRARQNENKGLVQSFDMKWQAGNASRQSQWEEGAP